MLSWAGAGLLVCGLGPDMAGCVVVVILGLVSSYWCIGLSSRFSGSRAWVSWSWYPPTSGWVKDQQVPGLALSHRCVDPSSGFSGSRALGVPGLVCPLAGGQDQCLGGCPVPGICPLLCEPVPRASSRALVYRDKSWALL